MSLPREVEARLDQHLDAIERVLVDQGTPRPERRSVIDEVDAQVREMLTERAGGEPTVADVEAILAELDPPEAYRHEGQPAARRDDAPLPRMSRVAVIGALWVALFVAAFFLMFTAHRVTVVDPATPPPGPTVWQWLLMIFVGVPGLLAPVGTTVCGLVAISQIRHSRGRLIGLPLALVDALLFPLVVMSLLIVWGVMALGETGIFDTLPRYAVVIGMSLLLVLANGLAIWLAWRAASRPVI